MRRSSERKQRLRGERRDYLRYLAQTRTQVRDRRARAAAGSGLAPPGPAALWSMVGTSRLWERRPADADFAEVAARGR